MLKAFSLLEAHNYWSIDFSKKLVHRKVTLFEVKVLETLSYQCFHKEIAFVNSASLRASRV